MEGEEEGEAEGVEGVVGVEREGAVKGKGVAEGVEGVAVVGGVIFCCEGVVVTAGL